MWERAGWKIAGPRSGLGDRDGPGVALRLRREQALRTLETDDDADHSTRSAATAGVASNPIAKKAAPAGIADRNRSRLAIGASSKHPAHREPRLSATSPAECVPEVGSEGPDRGLSGASHHHCAAERAGFVPARGHDILFLSLVYRFLSQQGDVTQRCANSRRRDRIGRGAPLAPRVARPCRRLLAGQERIQLDGSARAQDLDGDRVGGPRSPRVAPYHSLVAD